MLNKLAFRNALRSMKDYVIYLITVTLSFSCMFAFHLISYSEDVLNLSAIMENFKYVMYLVNGIMMFVICFLINYTTKFIFKKRSKEFGTYLMLGIKKKKITSLFTKENMMLGSLSFALSIPLGYLFSIIMSYIMMNIFELPQLIRINFTVSAIGLSFLYFLLIYFIVLILLRRRFKKMKIHDLLYFDRKQEKAPSQNLLMQSVVLVSSLSLGIFALINFDRQFIGVGVEPSMFQIMISILTLIISIYGITSSLINFILKFVLKHKKIKYQKDNLFVARMFSHKAKTMNITLGTLTLLITLTLVALNISSLFKGMFEYQIKQNAPYDISINLDSEESISKYIEKIEESLTIKDKFVHHTFYDSQNNIRSKLPKEFYSWHEQDEVMRQSDFNKLMSLKSEGEINLKEDEFWISCAKESCKKIETIAISEFILPNGKKLKLKEITNKGYDNTITNSSYFVVLPDQYVEDQIANSFLTINTVEKTTESFAEELMKLNVNDVCHMENNTYICYSLSNIVVKGKEEATNKGFMTITSFICFYIALIFTAVVGTILAIQQLSEAYEYKYRYNVLKRLGVKEKECYQIIKKQLVIFFFFPILIPCVVSFSTLHSMNKVFQIALNNNQEYLGYFFLNLVLFLSVYLLYFLATYFGYKKNIAE